MKKKIHLRSCFSALLFVLVIVFTDPMMAIPSLLAAAFHECGHLLFAKYLHIPIREMNLDLMGAHLSLSSGIISYKAEFFLCAGGPLFSFLLAEGMEHPFLNEIFPAFRDFQLQLADCSRFLGILNLLPVRGLDGARMLYSFLAILSSCDVAERIIRLFTGIFLILLWGISIYLLLLTDRGLPLFVFSFAMLCKSFRY